MTLNQLKNANPDIILDEAPWEEIVKNADGAAYFYVSLPNGNKPKDQRKILWAGHVLTVGLDKDVSGDRILLIRLTSQGNVRLDACAKKAISPGGNAVLFRTRPLAADDPRSRKPWNQWDEIPNGTTTTNAGQNKKSRRHTR